MLFGRTGQEPPKKRLGRYSPRSTEPGLEAHGHLVGLVGRHLDVPGLGAVAHCVQVLDLARKLPVKSIFDLASRGYHHRVHGVDGPGILRADHVVDVQRVLPYPVNSGHRAHHHALVHQAAVEVLPHGASNRGAAHVRQPGDDFNLLALFGQEVGHQAGRRVPLGVDYDDPVAGLGPGEHVGNGQDVLAFDAGNLGHIGS